jgi:ferric-dicitrate binding protein FerR (iron transport regulator)
MGGVFALSPMGYDTFDLKNETFQAFSVGKTKKVILEDGSIIWLKGNSSLTYPEHFVNATREVNLIGEALFEYSRNCPTIEYFAQNCRKPFDKSPQTSSRRFRRFPDFDDCI